MLLRYLVSFFYRRFFDAGQSSAEVRLTPKGAFALLVVPGCVMSILMMQKYSSLGRLTRKQWVWQPYEQAVADQHLFIVYCIVISAVIALLRWDSLFPDRRDYANLAPLPVETRTILTAKLLALCQFVLAFVVVVNAGSTLLFPPIVLEGTGTLSGLIRFVFAHAATMFLAGIWAFAVVLAGTGLITACVPFRLLRTAKRGAQFGGIVLLFLFVISTPELLKTSDSLQGFTWVPSLWFLALYQVLLARGTPELNHLALVGVVSTCAALTFAAVAYGLSCRMFFLRSAEFVPVSSTMIRVPEAVFGPLDATVFRKPYYGGCFRFIIKTLIRSERHSAALLAMLGLGMTVAALNLVTPGPAGILIATFVALYSLVTGLRVSFGVPSEPDANWLFRVAEGAGIDPRTIVHRSLACLAAPLVLVSTMALALLYDVRLAAIHFAYACLATALLIEIVTVDFRVLPFTCSWLPGRKNPAVAAMGWFAGLIAVGQMLGSTEYYFLSRPAGMAVLLTLLAAAIAVVHRAQSSAESATWSDTRGELELLKISD